MLGAGQEERPVVHLEADATERDRFGRLLRHVWRRDAGGGFILVNRQLVLKDYAVARPDPTPGRYDDWLRGAEIVARAQRRGV